MSSVNLNRQKKINEQMKEVMDDFDRFEYFFASHWKHIVYAAIAVVVVVVVAADAGVVGQLACQEICHSVIRIAGNAAVKLNASLRQSHLGTAADAAADQGVHLVGGQEASQGAVAGTGNIHYLGSDDDAVLHLVELELGAVAEVGEDLFILIGCCDNHG